MRQNYLIIIRHITQRDNEFDITPGLWYQIFHICNILLTNLAQDQLIHAAEPAYVQERVHHAEPAYVQQRTYVEPVAVAQPTVAVSNPVYHVAEPVQQVARVQPVHTQTNTFHVAEAAVHQHHHTAAPVVHHARPVATPAVQVARNYPYQANIKPATVRHHTPVVAKRVYHNNPKPVVVSSLGRSSYVRPSAPSRARTYTNNYRDEGHYLRAFCVFDNLISMEKKLSELPQNNVPL